MALGLGLSSRAAAQRRFLATLVNTTGGSYRQVVSVTGLADLLNDLNERSQNPDLNASDEALALYEEILSDVDDMPLIVFIDKFGQLLSLLAAYVPPVGGGAYSWGDPNLSWGQSGVAWGEEKDDTPVAEQTFSFGSLNSEGSESIPPVAEQTFSFGSVVSEGSETIIVAEQTFSFGEQLSTPTEGN